MIGDLSLRPATWADCERLFVWANSPDSLHNKRLTQSAIPYETHRQWLERRLGAPDVILLIAEENGLPVGQVRLELRNGAYEVDIFVIAEARGRGVAAAAFEEALQRLWDRSPEARARALVGSANAASEHLFERLGFNRTGPDGQFAVFERTSGTGMVE